MTVASPGGLVVLMTCFNRREQTARCLSTLHHAIADCGTEAVVSLCDDGSSDGTAEAARDAFPGVVVTRGTGSLFWAGGMRAAARSVAADLARADRVLLVNDDVVLRDDALAQLEERLAAGADIAIGQVSDPVTGGRTYGALAADSRWRPLRFRAARADEEIVTFNGNVVLLRGEAYRRLGGLDPRYTHGIADYDMGLRASRRGLRMSVTGSFVGTCELNVASRRWQSRSVPVRERIRIVTSAKGLPPREWLHFTTRFGGALWPVDFVSPYVRAVLGISRAKED